MDVLALIVSVTSVALAGLGTWLANKRATEALEEARRAAASALWSDLQDAVQRFIGFDPTMEPIGERLADLRIAGIALVDEMPSWAGLDKWLEAERALGAVLGGQVMEQAQPGDSVELRLANLHPYQRWAQVLSSNLRHFRANGYDADAANKLQQSAEQQAKAVYNEHGWALPSTSITGDKPIEP